MGQAHAAWRCLWLKARLYHIHDPELLPLGLMLLAAGKLVVYDAHENFPLQLLGKEYLPRVVRLLVSTCARYVENAFMRFFSAIITATPSIARRYGSLNRNTFVICNFPRLQELQGDRRQASGVRPRSIVYVGGGATFGRGLLQTIQALEAANRRHPPIALDLVGGLGADVRRRVERLSGWRWVREHGMLDREHLRDLLGNSRAGLLLYLPEPNHIDALPNKLFEYMASGVPVIASDFPLWREIVEVNGCGILVDPRDPEAIARAIEFLVTDEAQAQAMGERGRRAVLSCFNWAEEEAKLLAVYSFVGAGR
jgi:glycosyltransferase involved in cell wall biosynthesis